MPSARRSRRRHTARHKDSKPDVLFRINVSLLRIGIFDVVPSGAEEART
jgi:hypothetical protein